jgi:hypothetical protein
MVKRLRPDEPAGWLKPFLRRRSDTERCETATPPSMDGDIRGVVGAVNRILKKVLRKIHSP